MRRPVVRFTPEAAKLVSKLHPEIKTMIRSALEELRSNPLLGDDLREELSGFKSFKPKRYHRHLRGKEEPYQFVNIWRLLEDFKNDLARIRGRKWDEG